jgi:hypothetical protein
MNLKIGFLNFSDLCEVTPQRDLFPSERRGDPIVGDAGRLDQPGGR